MSKKELRPQEPKQPKTVAVREIVPWLVITAMSFGIAGIIGGWFIHSNVIGTAPNVTVEVKDIAQQ